MKKTYRINLNLSLSISRDINKSDQRSEVDSGSYYSGTVVPVAVVEVK